MNKTPQIFNIYLRPAEITDAPFFMKLMNSPDWKYFIGDRKIDSIAKSEQYIKEKMLPQKSSHGYTNNVIVLDNSNLPIGSMGLFHRKPKDLIPDIGFSLLPEYYKKGIAYKAGIKQLNLGFEKHQLPAISAYTTHENTASRRLIEKLGLRYITDEALPGDDGEILMKFLITKEEFFSRK